MSTDKQNLHLQPRALEQAGGTRLFEDKGLSGALAQRPALDQACRQSSRATRWSCGSYFLWPRGGWLLIRSVKLPPQAKSMM
jgi:hypothetical protein